MDSVLPPVKSVVVYKNGDPFYTGRRFVVNQRQVATMEAFLNEVTQSIGAPLAIRTLYTPRQGHRVPDLQHLQTGAQYVAAGFEKFKKMDYLNMAVKKHPTAREEPQAKVIPRPNVSAKWRKFIPVPCILHVFRNGDLLCPPFRFIIPRSMRQDLEQILGLITEKVSLRTGAVRRWVTPADRHGHSRVQHHPKACVPPGSALWRERPCPRLPSWKLAATMLPWELSD
ncbi:unnamed protein product [Tetraodon nigroviridis]|uniref:(spotted green pufferfish) hypothetical protein n=1 Tax=Tetraodon nigroviridis TaxID=99883 RepID=Q4RMC9_TETNG|nr:unnamed protein product [Tetraodon nigroviridis]